MNSMVPSSYLVNHYILNSLPTSNVTSVSLAEHPSDEKRCGKYVSIALIDWTWSKLIC